MLVRDEYPLTVPRDDMSNVVRKGFTAMMTSVVVSYATLISPTMLGSLAGYTDGPSIHAAAASSWATLNTNISPLHTSPPR